MIASFAAYLLLLSLLIGLAALAGEQTLLRWWRPRRFVWVVALCASLAFPLAMSLGRAPPAPAAASAPPFAPLAPLPASTLAQRQSPEMPAAATAQMSTTTVVGTPPASRPVLSFSTLVGIAWAVSALTLWLFYASGIFRLLVTVRACPRITVFGVPARLTENLGPAVFGIWRPVILWPRWLQTAPPRMQRAALAHELQHCSASDPLMLGAAMFLVALAPWNPLLWWQLRRLRFAVEADCDVRVLQHGLGAFAYAEALLRIGHRRASGGAAFAMLMSAPSWLERRIRLLLQPPRRGGWRAGSAIPVSVLLLIAAAWVHAPSLAASQLRKLPPEDTRPAAGWAIATVRAQFPLLMQRRFQGTAIVAAVFDRQGHLQLAVQHRFAPGIPTTDFDMSLENRRLDIEPSEDVLYAGNEGAEGSSTIGPWLASRNPGRLFIVYEVLKWAPDPTRSSACVLAALRAYAPALFVKPASVGPTTLVAVMMNNDGTVNRLQKRTIAVGQSFKGDWASSMYTSMGVTKEELGRTGELAGPAATLIDYAWPRRADDAPDVAELDKVLQRVWKNHPPHEDAADDAALAQRYFPDIVQHGRAAVTYQIDGRRAQASPWILFGRDGRVWGTGRWHNDEWRIVTGPRSSAIEPRFPGALVVGGYSTMRVRGVPVAAMYIAPNSPIQSEAEVRWAQQKRLLVSGEFFMRAYNPAPASLPLAFASALDFGGDDAFGGMPTDPLMELTATPLDRQEVSLSIRFSVCGLDKGIRSAPSDCLRSTVVRANYDSPIDIPLSSDPQTQAMVMRIVLRIQRLRT